MREIKEIRKRLFGDTKKAATYIGLARTLLGQVKNQAAFGGLSQLSRVVDLPDGTRIAVDTRFGQDTIEIVSPVRPGAGREEVTLPRQSVDTPALDVPAGFVIAGYREVPATPLNLDRALVWSGYGQATDLGILPGMRYGQAQAISGDGRIAVGWNILDGSVSGEGFYWTRAGGLQIIPRLGKYSPTPVGVSRRGEIAITAFPGQFVGAKRWPYIWSEAAGWQELPPDTSFNTTVTGISADGSVVVGQIVTAESAPDVPSDTAAVYWKDGGTPVRITSGEGYYWALGVSERGGVICGSRFEDGSSGYYPYMWTADGGVRVLPGGIGVASAVSEDGSIIVGTLGTVFAPNFGPPTVATYAGTPVWWRADGTGPFTLPTPAGGTLSAVSKDGNLIAGSVYNAVGDFSNAAVWNRDRLLHTYTDGTWARGIGVPDTAHVPGVHVDL